MNTTPMVAVPKTAEEYNALTADYIVDWERFRDAPAGTYPSNCTPEQLVVWEDLYNTLVAIDPDYGTHDKDELGNYITPGENFVIMAGMLDDYAYDLIEEDELSSSKRKRLKKAQRAFKALITC